MVKDKTRVPPLSQFHVCVPEQQSGLWAWCCYQNMVKTTHLDVAIFRNRRNGTDTDEKDNT